jgi:iron(III) transport system ATP-binding protein
VAEVVVDRVSKSFGQVVVLDGLSLRVRDGGTMAVVGPSGCGKTTLLRLIAGFETVDAGEVVIGGETVAGPVMVPAHRRRVGYLPQDGALFPHLDVAGNIGFGLDGAGDRDDRIDAMLELVSLDRTLRHRRPDQLSGGQQQRVALARALAVRPRVMLLDEPFSALDADLRIETRRAVRALLDELAMTTIIVTHDRDDAIAVADDVAVVDRGSVVSTGPVREAFPRGAFGDRSGPA